MNSWTNRVAAAVRNFKAGPHIQEGEPVETPARKSGARAFNALPAYKFIERHKLAGRMIGVGNPFFRTLERRDGATGIMIDGKRCLNFAWCDYLGLSSHPAVARASQLAIDDFGTCVSASRMVGGQFPLHRELETEIAKFCGTEDALLFVSGHAANVSTIATLMGTADLVVYDEFIHNSAVIGARLSGAAYRTFPHNDLDALESILQKSRHHYENALIIVEGMYSTEGDITDLARVIAIKERYGAWLMVDDAHGVGVLGATGRGCVEHCAVDPRSIDIMMGTLSKTLASCGGYIAGSTELIEILKYTAPGFVYSVGLLPSMTAAAMAALRLLKAEPERVARLRQNGKLFQEEARAAGLDTGNSCGRGMIPVIVGSATKTGRVAHRLFERGLNISFIIYPGVPINAARLRFFVTSEHSAEEIASTVRAVKEELDNFW